MLDQLLILAESGAHHSEGIPPYLVGIGFFVVLMCLLGITYLFSGLNHSRHLDQSARRASQDGPHSGTSSHGPSSH